MAIVYKYLPSDRKSYLDDELLRFTQPGALNDPFECIPIVPTLNVDKFIKGIIARSKTLFELKYGHDKQALKRLHKSLPKITADFRQRYRREPEYLPNLFMEFYVNHANKNIGIFSLSRRWNSTLMWAHYTNSHSGFCVGYDSSHTFFSRQLRDANDVGTLNPVEYAADRIQTNIDSGIDIDVNIFYRKSNDWKYEEEERLVRHPKHASKAIRGTPFDIYLFTVPHSAIVEIIYGINADQELKNKISSVGDSLGIPVYEALISPASFDVERKLIG